MRAIITWKGKSLDDSVEIEHDDPQEFARQIEAKVLSVHAVLGKAPITIALEDGLLNAKVSCGTCQTSYQFSVHPWALNAAVLAVHSDHEGHPLKIEYNYKGALHVIKSPKHP